MMKVIRQADWHDHDSLPSDFISDALEILQDPKTGEGRIRTLSRMDDVADNMKGIKVSAEMMPELLKAYDSEFGSDLEMFLRDYAEEMYYNSTIGYWKK